MWQDQRGKPRLWLNVIKKNLTKNNSDKLLNMDMFLLPFTGASCWLCSFDHFLKVWQTLSLPSFAFLCPSSVCLTVSLPAHILLWRPRPVYVHGAHTVCDVSALWRGFASKHFITFRASCKMWHGPDSKCGFCAAERPCRQPLQLDLNDGKSHFGNLGFFFFSFFS